MARVTKRTKDAVKLIDKAKVYTLEEALDNLAKFPKVKFDETVELHFHLNVDPKSTDQVIRGTVILPHGLGKKIRIVVFAKGEQVQAAKDCGVDYVGAQDLIEKISNGFLDFDCVIATPDMMRDISKLGRVLGPRGLMPSPKSGTVTNDVARAIKEVNAGKIEFKSDKQAGIHVGIGKRSFSQEQLLKNAKHLIDAISHVKPGSIKGSFIKSLYLSSTMGPGMRIAI
ncbi:MAG: 50S ribosomal protein L1 [Candidatus Omnitrophota bacterium]